MALEAVFFPQDLFGYICMEWYAIAAAAGGGGAWGCDSGVDNEEGKREAILEYKMNGGGLDENRDTSCCSLVQKLEGWDVNSASPEAPREVAVENEVTEAVDVAGRRKRRRTRSVKNKEEEENQRMTHIAVERNRRKQMNEYLAVLRSLMPPSYVQRGDQASIVGGAINYVKELEQLLQSLEVQKRLKLQTDAAGPATPFADFFTFPQYSFSSSNGSNSRNTNASVSSSENNSNFSTHEKVAENRSAVADIEVTMVESHANLKVLSKRRPGQLLKLIAGLQNVRLTPLHLNVTTVDQMVLYSFSLKVEDDCLYTSVDDIATAVYQMLGRIQEEANYNGSI